MNSSTRRSACICCGCATPVDDSPRPAPEAPNLAEKHPDVVKKLFALGKADGGGSFPKYLLEQAESAIDAPGCSPFAAIR